jgi:HEAT repeat protein
MFQPRSTDFSDPRVTAIVGHLRAIERELADIGRKAGRRASANVSAAGDQIAEAISPILNEILDRFRGGRRAAVEGAASLGDEAVKIGARVGDDALGRLARQTRQRPLLTLAVAIGVGILIGTASRRH